MKSTVYKLIIIVNVFFIHLASVFAQNQPEKYIINWASDSVLSNKIKKNSNTNYFPRYQPSQFADFPMVYLKIPVSSKKNRVSVVLNETSAAIIDKNYSQLSVIKNDVQINYHTVLEKKQAYLLVSFLPIVKNTDGSFSKIDSYSLLINALREDANISFSANTYKNTSILASGNWFKIAVKNEGIYKLNSDFFRKMGIDVNLINPKNIRVYGNGGYLLPQSNSAVRVDDLQENAIEVFGEADGKFDNTDYVLFYAPGNTKWELKNNQYFEHKQNFYTDSSYYFINVDLGLGKRIIQNSRITQTPNYTSNSFNNYQLYEQDLYTLITSSMKSGRNWYGEDFEFNSNRNFDFNVSGLQSTAPFYVKTNMAIRANVVSNATVKVNNQNLYNLTSTAVPQNFETDFAKPISSIYNITGIVGNTATVNITYNKPNSTANAWLDYIEINCKRAFTDFNGYLRFRDLDGFAPNNISLFNLNVLTTDAKVWDITDFYNPKNDVLNFNGNSANFVANTPTLKEYVAFNQVGTKEPTFVGKIQNQNLHALPQADFLIVTAAQFFNEAKRLADYRKATQGISYNLVTTEQVFNEFSSGGRDATAIRDFVKMFYDRAGVNTALMPKYLLLFGKGSFDNRMLKFKENNFVVTYQSENSLSPTQSYTSDDYFALLDDSEGAFPEDFVTNPGLLDIAVGRIPAKTITEAKNVVDKLIDYEKAGSFADWRNQITIVADDEDNNLHLNQAEANANLIMQNSPNQNIDKIYFDAYQQENAAGGTTYPKAKEALNQKINSGTFLVNYTGHGGESGWAQERVLTLNDIHEWRNPDKLAIIFTATCSFSRWDDPETVSGGELSLINKSNGVPSIFSTTRIVFASYNFDLNQSFLRALFNPANSTKKVSFGQIFLQAKNNNVGGLNINSRNFTLLGDPTALFPIPINKVITTTLPDTLKAGQKVTIKGFVGDENGQIRSQFNGVVYPTIFDKPSKISTLGQDNQVNGSFVQAFELQKNILYKGKATVSDGSFSFEFIVPRDINLQVGKGKISYYANNNVLEASGANSTINIGGLAANADNDKQGPTIQTFLNDENFVSGGITNANPILLVNLNDLSGINTTGIGIGHDIVATLSGVDMNDRSIILNEFYQANLDSYQSGVVKYQFNGLTAGLYTLKVKAWDVFNNSAEQIITFEVKETAALELAHVLNYPNPFTTRTSFQFEHNYPNQDLEVQINIRTITGRLVKTINQTINTAGNRVNNIFWDAKDDFGEKIARGIYIYELKVRSTTGGITAKKTEKLLIL
ncbi:type IX secretion system sortase PorU [Pedobacter alpinus]|uniref:Type IX secretion system sortase PorU n=1 Tax=Pedobacter alpinus TaxID=1590643 RepID=A0ABW5TSY5_9SPHI